MKATAGPSSVMAKPVPPPKARQLSGSYLSSTSTTTHVATPRPSPERPDVLISGRQPSPYAQQTPPLAMAAIAPTPTNGNQSPRYAPLLTPPSSPVDFRPPTVVQATPSAPQSPVSPLNPTPVPAVIEAPNPVLISAQQPSVSLPVLQSAQTSQPTTQSSENINQIRI